MNDYQQTKELPAENDPAITKCIFPSPWRPASQLLHEKASMQLFLPKKFASVGLDSFLM